MFWIIISSIMPLAILIGIVSLISHYVRKKISNKSSLKSEFSLSLSEDDNLRQSFFFLSLLFLGITLMSLNKYLINQFSPETILMVTVVLGFAISYYFKVIYTLIFSMVGFMVWLPWVLSDNIGDIILSVTILILGMISLIYYVIGRLHKSKRFSVVYIVPSFVIVYMSLFILSSHSGLKEIEHSVISSNLSQNGELTLSLMFMVIFLFFATLYSLIKKTIGFYEALGIGSLMLVFWSIPFISETPLFIHGNSLTESGLVWLSIFNILTFVVMVATIFLGYKRKERWMINLSSFSVLIFIFVKYFDWLFDFISKSLFFFVGGILLFVVGWFMEKGRKKMIQEININNENNLI